MIIHRKNRVVEDSYLLFLSHLQSVGTLLWLEEAMIITVMFLTQGCPQCHRRPCAKFGCAFPCRCVWRICCVLPSPPHAMVCLTSPPQAQLSLPWCPAALHWLLSPHTWIHCTMCRQGRPRAEAHPFIRHVARGPA